MNVLTPTLGLGVGYSEQYVQLSKCSNVSTRTLELLLLPLRASDLTLERDFRDKGGC